MKNKQFLIIGALVAVVIWSVAAFVSFSENESQFEKKSSAGTSVPVGASATPPEDEAVLSELAEEENVEPLDFEEPEQGVPAGEVAPALGEPVAGTPSISAPQKASRIPKPPRKALAIFKDVGEICIDADSGEILFEKNSRKQHPPASVTKIMTYYLVLDALAQKKISLEQTVLASKRAFSMGGTQLDLDVGEPCKIEELIYGLLLQSANDGAVALAEAVCGNVEDFVALMNKTARELGMRNTKFVTPHGLPPSRSERKAGAVADYSSAEDLAKLSAALIKKFPDSLKYSSTFTHFYPANEKRKAPRPLQNHNALLWNATNNGKFPGCDGLKTGWTNDGASIVTTASLGNRRVIAVVLGGLVRNKKGEIDAKTSQRERNQRAAELMYNGLKRLDALQYEPTPYKK